MRFFALLAKRFVDQRNFGVVSKVILQNCLEIFQSWIFTVYRTAWMMVSGMGIPWKFPIMKLWGFPLRMESQDNL